MNSTIFSVGMIVLIGSVLCNVENKENTTIIATTISSKSIEETSDKQISKLEKIDTLKEKKYQFSYETENQKRNERIKVTNIEDNEEKDDRIVFHGRYSHVDADGIEYIVTYIADKKGYRPVVNVKRPNT